jgi:hypothetical protein
MLDQPWQETEVDKLRAWLVEHVDNGEIARRLGRSRRSVASKARVLTRRARQNALCHIMQRDKP